MDEIGCKKKETVKEFDMDKTDNYAERFAKNLRAARKRCSMKQAELAERIGYSEKSISKWESGGSLPPFEVMIELCAALGTDLYSLIDGVREETYYLGIDGGATKTEFVLADGNGTVLRSVKLPSSNPFDIGIEKSKATLTQGIRDVCRDVKPASVSLYAGLSGGVSGDMKQTFSNFFATFGFSSAKNGSDANDLLAAGLGHRNGAALIMGTGCSCFIQKDGEVFRAGGLGYLFDGAGGGYDLGRGAIKAACMQEDLSGETTVLNDLIRKRTGHATVLEDLGHFYEIGKSGIAAFAPLVFDAYDMGDRAAERILLETAGQAALLLDTACRRLETDRVEVIAVGGLTARFDLLKPMIEHSLCERGRSAEVDLRVYDGDPVYGALLNAGMRETPNFRVEY